MTFFDATEQAYRNGYEQGRKDAAKCGQWIFSKNGLYWTCSECKVISLEHTRYCPNCGAKMDLPEEYNPSIPRDQWEDRARFD